MALHMRLHEFGTEALVRMGSEDPSAAIWGELLEVLVDQMLANRKIFLLHERNQAAFEASIAKTTTPSMKNSKSTFDDITSDDLSEILSGAVRDLMG